MKTIIPWLLLGFVLNAGGQQDKPAEILLEKKTQIEAVPRTGFITVEGLSKIGTVGEEAGSSSGGVDVASKEVITPNDAKRQFFISVTVRSRNFGPLQTTSVEFDEIDSQVKGIDYLEKLDASVTKLDSFTAYYTTKSGLVLATSNDRRYAQICSGGAVCFLSMEDLGRFKKLVQQAKERLDSIRK
jgi:hypothetical protein